ncbi:short-chain dehydrogenase, partial [Burkholderia pseudomallei]
CMPILSVAAHPGYAATNLQFAGPVMANSSLCTFAMRLSKRLVAQSADVGALHAIHAATPVEVEGGAYIGPALLWEPR